MYSTSKILQQQFHIALTYVVAVQTGKGKE